MWDLLIISIIAYLGLVSGYVIIHFAIEEKKLGMKYFNVFLPVLFFLSIIPVFLENKILGFIYAIFSIGYIFIKLKNYFAYFLYAIFFALLNSEYLVYYSLIIFLYGLCNGAIIYEKKWKNFSIVAYMLLFVVVTNLIRLIL